MRLTRPLRPLVPVVAIAAAITMLPSCGQKTDEAKRAAGMVPANAVSFVSASLDPSIEQKRNLLSMAARFPKARDKVRKNFNDTREGLLTDALKQACLDYDKDVKPWLGSEVATAVLPRAGSTDTDTLVLLRVKHEAKARAALEKPSGQCELQKLYDHRFVNGFAVVATGDDAAANKAALDAVESTAKSKDGGLAKSDDFVRLVEQLHGDRLLVGYVDGKQAVAAGARKLDSNGCDVLPAAGVTGKAAFDLHAESNAIVLEGAANESSAPLQSGDPKLTEALPDTTTGSFTVFDIDGLIRTLVRCTGQEADLTGQLADQTGLDLEFDVLEWMGGEAVLVTGPFRPGRSLPEFGVVVKTTDHAKAATAVDKLRKKLTEDGQKLTEFDAAGAKGITIDPAAEDGTQPALVLLDDRLIVATSPAYARDLAGPAKSTLGDTKRYQAVVGTSTAGSGATQMQLVVDIKAIKDAIVASLPRNSQGRYQRDVAPQLDPLDSLGLRLSSKDGLSLVELRVALR